MFLIKWLTQFFSNTNSDTHKVCKQYEPNSHFEHAEDLPLTLSKQSEPNIFSHSN